MIEAETETAESPIKKAGQMVLTMGSTSVLEGVRNVGSRVPLSSNRQSQGRSSIDHLGYDRIAINGINVVDAIALAIFGESLC